MMSNLKDKLKAIDAEIIIAENKRDLLHTEWIRVAHDCPKQILVKAERHSDDADYYGCSVNLPSGCNHFLCPLLMGWVKEK